MEKARLPEPKGQLSIMARIQKLRARKSVEELSGISAANEELFLPICLLYEQDFELLFTDRKFGAHSEVSESFWDDWDKY